MNLIQVSRFLLIAAQLRFYDRLRLNDCDEAFPQWKEPDTHVSPPRDLIATRLPQIAATLS